MSTPIAPVRLLGRRRFVADLGKGTLAFAVIGLAGCTASSNDGSSAGSSDVQSSEDTGASAGTTGAVTPSSEGPIGDALRWQQVSFSNVSAYLLIRGEEVAVVDTGFGGDLSLIQDGLGQLGADWSDVAHVILTHSHPDHVGGLGDVLRNATSATTYAGTADVPALDGLVGVDTDSIRAINDGDEVFGLQIIGTPGHTPGHISVFDPDSGLLVAGDALNGPGGVLTGPNPQFTPDMDTANASVKVLAQREVEAILVGHGTPIESGAGALLSELAANL